MDENVTVAPVDDAIGVSFLSSAEPPGVGPAREEEPAAPETCLTSSSASPPATAKARSLAAGQVNRIVDGALPEGMSVARDARIALQKCATISLLYLACLADAERKAAGSSRTTLNVQDIRAALEAAGMAHLLPRMTTAAKRARD